MKETFLAGDPEVRTEPGLDLYSVFISAAALGDIRPGERLSEESLAARWKVGRAPVREALLQLEHDGLVVRQPKSGTFLRKIELPEVAELYEIRVRLEPMLAETAARIATDEQLEELARLADEADEMDIPAHEKEVRDLAFHARLGQVSGLAQVTRVVNLARLHLRRCPTLHQRVAILGRYSVSQPGHREIASPLLARDAQRAAAAMAEHLANAKKATLKDLEEIRSRMETARLHTLAAVGSR